MAALVIALPVYSASVFAGIVRASATGGTDGIENYIRDEDWVFFNVDLTIHDDDDITPDQLMLLPAGIAFDNCVGPNLDGTTTCTLRFPGVDTWYFIGESPYVIRAYNDAGGDAGTRTGYIVVDNKAPAVTSFSITPELVGSQALRFSYSIEDYAYKPGDKSMCSGISRIEFYNFDASFVEVIDINTDDCTASGSIDFDSSLFAEGGNTIYAKAFDRFEQESDPEEDSFSVDRTGPEIDTASFKVVDAEGNSIEFIGVEPIEAELSVEISGADLDPNSVAADLSELNVERTDYTAVKASCVPLPGKTRCTWSVSIKLDSSGTKNVYVDASDYSGNPAAATLSKSFVLDDMAPVVTEIKTDKVYGGINYAFTYGNTITASITEVGVGIDKNDIILYIDKAGSTADYCDAGACYWYDVDFAQEGTSEALIGYDSTDKLGNHIDSFDADIIVDATAPEYISMEYSIIGGALPAYDYLKTLDSLEITINVKEKNIIAEAYADFSSIIQGAGKVIADDCTRTDDTYTCTWRTSPVDVEGYIDDFVYFNFTDGAGNSLVVTSPVEVYELTDAALDYWTHKVSCSPELIDRQTTEFVNHRIYCHVKLLGNAETIGINLEECTGPTEYLDEAPVLLSNNPGSTDPYIKFTLPAEKTDITQLDFTCKLRIVSKISTQITRYPEVEEVPVTIGFYNMPLGEYSDEVNKDIKAAKEFAWYIDDWVEDLNNILRYGDLICNTMGALAKLYNTLSAIGTALAIGEKEYPPLSEIRKKVQSAQEGLGGLSKDQFGGGEGFQKFCKFMSCRLFYDEAWGGEDSKGGKESIGSKVGKWQHTVMDNANWVATAGDRAAGLEAWTNTDDLSEVRMKSGKLNPKESIVLSVLTLCLPGIVYNLNKLRQIQCMYADCVQNYAAYGLPLSACTEQKEYATCKYWWGEAFQLLPYTGLLNEMIGLVKKALSSPWGFLDMTLAYVCTYLIKSPDGTGAQICLINDMFALIADVYEDIKGLEEQWGVQEDYCKNI